MLSRTPFRASQTLQNRKLSPFWSIPHFYTQNCARCLSERTNIIKCLRYQTRYRKWDDWSLVAVAPSEACSVVYRRNINRETLRPRPPPSHCSAQSATRRFPVCLHYLYASPGAVALQLYQAYSFIVCTTGSHRRSVADHTVASRLSLCQKPALCR